MVFYFLISCYCIAECSSKIMYFRGPDNYLLQKFPQNSITLWANRCWQQTYKKIGIDEKTPCLPVPLLLLYDFRLQNFEVITNAFKNN